MKNLIRKSLNYVNHSINRKRYSIESADVSWKARIGKQVTILERSFVDAQCSIDSYTFIGKNCNITKSSIGRYCSIANNVSIGMGEHPIETVSTSALFCENPYETFTQKACVIEHDVWIGTDCIILRGVKVSTGAVIGANSVVTGDIPPFAIAVGSPAKVVRYRFSHEKIDRILKSKWWDKELEEAKKIIAELENERF